MLAAEIGLLDIARILVDHGASVDLQDQFGSSALMYACLQGKKKKEERSEREREREERRKKRKEKKKKRKRRETCT